LKNFLPKLISCYRMVWEKVTEKNTIAANSGKEFDINGKKIAILIQGG